jgi:CRP/FNR family transcriptional regulator, cyclic AMP receptor protein
MGHICSLEYPLKLKKTLVKVMIVSIPIEILAQIPIFQTLQPAKLQQLSEAGNVIQCQSRNILYTRNDSLRDLYILVSGHVKLYRQSGERVQILALLRSGDCFGTEALSDNLTSSYSAAAVTDATLILIPADTMRLLMEKYPQLRVIMLQLVTGRLRQFASLVHDLAFRDVAARLATILVTRAEQDGRQTPDGIAFPRLMTQSELATMVGAAREVVQRTFKKFEKSGIIRVSRKEILVFDLDGLKQIAEEEAR